MIDEITVDDVRTAIWDADEGDLEALLAYLWSYLSVERIEVEMEDGTVELTASDDGIEVRKMTDSDSENI